MRSGAYPLQWNCRPSGRYCWVSGPCSGERESKVELAHIIWVWVQDVHMDMSGGEVQNSPVDHMLLVHIVKSLNHLTYPLFQNLGEVGRWGW